jgi:uncharacterized repeat protein (TIGR02543 family)
VTYGSTYGTLPSTSRTGYTFAGWFTASSGGSQVTSSSTVTITSNQTLYAQWTAFTTPDEYREMVSIPIMTATGSGSSGVFISDRTVSLSPYQMAKYETTYELWYEVKTWANANGYTITSNTGREGHDGTTGAAPTSAKTEPVTVVNWQEAIVWCNAYSEMAGKTPVYTYSGDVIRNATNHTACSNAVMNRENDGYRLPTEAEWEAAARGGDPSNETHWAYTYAGSNTIGNVAWYEGNSGSATHAVGEKAANPLGLHDMIGNVREWCWDWYETPIKTGTVTDPAGPTSGNYRILRGGGWASYASYCTVSNRETYYPNNVDARTGFRVVCKAE